MSDPVAQMQSLRALHNRVKRPHADELAGQGATWGFLRDDLGPRAMSSRRERRCWVLLTLLADAGKGPSGPASGTLTT